MSAVRSNARAGAWPRAAWIAVPALLAILALGGVTVRPALELSNAREIGARVAEREVRWEAARAELGRLAESRTRERLAAALGEVRALVPADPGAVGAHALLWLVAQEVALELDTLRVGEPFDLDPDGTEDPLLGREACLEARGSPAALARLVERVRELGQPCAVADFALERASAREREFDLDLCLILYLTPAAPSGAAGGDEGAR